MSLLQKLLNLNENAKDLNVGAPVVITLAGQFKDSTGVIDSFGKDKAFVVVNLWGHGKHSFQSTDVEVDLDANNDDADDDAHDDKEPTKFWVVVFDEDEHTAWIGLVEKDDNWRESIVKGDADYRWGGRYMSYLSPDDVMSHIRSDYRRGYSKGYIVKGPFFTQAKAEAAYEDLMDGEVTEEKVTEQNLEDWMNSVKKAYPALASKFEFKSRIEDGKHLFWAQIPGADRAYGVYDADKEEGEVLHEVKKETHPILGVAPRKGTVAYGIWKRKVDAENKATEPEINDEMIGTAKIFKANPSK